MPSYKDLISLVKEQTSEKILPAIWDFFPCHAGAIGGVTDFLRYYFDVDEKLAMQQKLQELFPEALILPGIFPDLGVIVEVSAFGGQITWFEKGAPFIGESIRNLNDIDFLKLPKIGLSGLMPLALKQREVMRRKLKEKGKEMELWGMSMGPAEVSGLLMGYENFYLGMYDDPARIKKLMEAVTELIIGWLHLQRKEFGGLDVMCIADHVCNQVTPAQLREFILPYEKAIFAEFPHAVKIYHNEGFHSDQHVGMALEFGADIWHFGSDRHDLGDLLEKVSGKIILFGGLDPHGCIRHGAPEEVRRETMRALQQARGHKLILSTGTGTTPETTFENQRAMIETAAHFSS